MCGWIISRVEYVGDMGAVSLFCVCDASYTVGPNLIRMFKT